VQDNGQTNGTDDFKTDTGTASFTVTEVNDAPVATDDVLTSVAEDSGIRTITYADLTGNDSTGPADESGQTLTVTGVSAAVGGTVAIVSGHVEFTPTANFNGTASFDYRVQDNGTTNGALDAKTDIGTASFTVTEVNDAPVATDDVGSSVAEDSGTRTIALAALTSNDNDGDPGVVQTLTITAVSNAVGGTVLINGTNVEFTPTANFNGTASFDYTVQDNGTTNGALDAKTDIGQVSFIVTAVNDAPVVDLNGVAAGNDNTASYPSGISQLLIAPSATITDVDSPSLASMTVRLTNAKDSSLTQVGELLSLNAAATTAAIGLAVSGVASSSNTVYTLTITGSASLATYQTILKGVQYTDIKPASHNTTPRTVDVVVNDGTVNSVPHSVTISVAAPAGVAGEPINLALTDPSADHVGAVTVAIAGVPAGWTLNEGTKNGDGTWTVQTNNIATLSITSPGDYTGALVLNVTQSWTNADGSTGTALVADNVEVFAPGAPIFAWSGDDHLTGSSGDDLFVFAQPIGDDIIHTFDAAHDQVDLIGFAGIAGFADVQEYLASNAAGEAVLTLSDGMTITFDDVNVASLSADNFLFDQEPITDNAGSMAVSDGAMLPLSGIINNTGTIALNSSGSETYLELIQQGIMLQGGGALSLSDSGGNIISGTGTDVSFTNLDNRISGAGQLGAGQMTLVNSGTIHANGSNALVIDTGTNVVTNSGRLEATGSGGLVVDSALANSGSLWANGGNITLHGDVTGAGSATISGAATIEFGAASDQNVTFAAGAAGMLKLDVSAGFTGSVSGFVAGDSLDLGDVRFGDVSLITYAANDAGTGGTLIVSDGTHAAQITLAGQYAAAGAQADGQGGTLLAYDAPAVDHIMQGGAGNDILVGGAGNDTLIGGSGNDMYLFNRGGGQDLVVDSGGSADTMAFSAGVNPFDLLLSRQANDLRIAVYGSSDQVTIQNWYGGTDNQVETIQAGNGQTLLSTQVDQMIQAMAQFSANNNGMTWDQGIAQKPEEVQTVLAANWQ
jgi:hypothetical protein